uniref:Uncharacterized protein n=1 Tax=Nelumbo nucifera TaxID=4432 RepID=A0A822YZ49_NELNU|nr:TPA_asm: hypothetical protein HUJ06_005148 [Nelumbo nucifera]
MGSRRSTHADEDEEALKWAALEKLPTYDRLRTSPSLNLSWKMKVDVRKLDINDRHEFIERIFRVAEEDNEKFLRKLRNRIDNGVQTINGHLGSKKNLDS